MSFLARNPSDAELGGARVARQAAVTIEGMLAEQGISHEQLASRLGVSVGRVHQMLAGEGDLTVGSLAMLAEGLCAQVEIRFSPRPPAARRSDHDGEDDPGVGTAAPNRGSVLAGRRR